MIQQRRWCMNVYEVVVPPFASHGHLSSVILSLASLSIYPTAIPNHPYVDPTSPPYITLDVHLPESCAEPATPQAVVGNSVLANAASSASSQVRWGTCCTQDPVGRNPLDIPRELL